MSIFLGLMNTHFARLLFLFILVLLTLLSLSLESLEWILDGKEFEA